MAHKIGIIGGSGLDDPELFLHPRDLTMDTPWGEPSSTLREGEIGGVPVVLLARHGREHTIPPSRVNYRANIHALEKRGLYPHPGQHGRGVVARGNPAGRSGGAGSVYRLYAAAAHDIL